MSSKSLDQLSSSTDYGPGRPRSNSRFQYSSETIADLSKSIDLDFDPPQRRKASRRSLDAEIDLFGDSNSPNFSQDVICEDLYPLSEDEQPPSHRPSFLRTINENVRDTSTDSITATLLSTSVTSYRQEPSNISFDNSCFDLTDQPSTSKHGTPVEKVFPKDIKQLFEKMACLEKDLKEQKSTIAGFESDEDKDKPTTSSDKQVDSKGTSSESIDSLDDDVTAPPSAAELSCISPVVRHRDGRMSIRYPKPKSSGEMFFTSGRSAPPRLDLVVGGPGCEEKAVFPPSPISPQPDMPLPHHLPEMKINMVPSRRSTGKRYGNLRLIEILKVKIISVKGLRGHSNKPIYVVAKLDLKDIFYSQLQRDHSEAVLEEFSHDCLQPFSNFHLLVLEGSRASGKTPRPIGKISLKRKDIVNQAGAPFVTQLQAVSKCQEVQGQICLDIRRDERHLSLRVVDYSGLGLTDEELYLVVSTASNKDERLRIGKGRFSEQWLKIPCDEGVLSLKMTLWHDLLRGLNSVCHGQVRAEVDEKWTNGPTKWFYLRPRNTDGASKEKQSLGEVKMVISYTADHVLPTAVYQPLLSILHWSLSTVPFSASAISLMEHLPKIDLSLLSRPLVQSFAYSKHLRQLLVALYITDIQKCQDYNTLFRSQTLASKMLYELLKMYGHSYLLLTLKPAIDKIYKERKSCEIDPSRMSAGESTEKNANNLFVYFELIFNRLMDSVNKCPTPIKRILADLRNVVAEKTGRLEVERLALLSFLIMRFFAAAILNPKHFGVKRDQPDPKVGRTLVLLSKLLQRLSNCCVNEQSLSTKEPWLSDLLAKITDTKHRSEMVRFLDRMSLYTSESSSSSDSMAVLKEGYLNETRSSSRTPWRKMLRQKKRYVILTDMDLLWQKSHRGELNPKRVVPLSSIKSIFLEKKLNIVIRTTKEEEISFECGSIIEASDWYSIIDKQRSRIKSLSSQKDLHDLYDSDVERELEALHLLLLDHVNTLTVWKSLLETDQTTSPSVLVPPIPAALLGSSLEPKEAEEHRKCLLKTLAEVLSVTYSIETAHKEAVNQYMSTVSKEKGSKDHPIGQDNYLLLRRQLHLPPSSTDK